MVACSGITTVGDDVWCTYSDVLWGMSFGNAGVLVILVFLYGSVRQAQVYEAGVFDGYYDSGSLKVLVFKQNQ